MTPLPTRTNVLFLDVEFRRIRKMLEEHDPLMSRVNANLAMDVVQGNEIVSLQGSVAALVTSQAETNKNLSQLINLMLQQRYNKQMSGGHP